MAMERPPSRGGWRSLFSRKSIAQVIRESETPSYRRALGPWSLTGIGVAGIIGAGVFVLTGIAARGAGPSVMVSYALVGLACIFAALAFAELASMVPVSGSAYAYAFASLGQFPAFLVAWLLILEYMVGNMVVAIGWSGTLTSELGQLGWTWPSAITQAPGADPSGLFDLPAAIIVLGVTALVAVGIRESARVSNALTLFKILVVVLFVAVGLFFINPGNYEPFAPGGFEGIGRAAALIFFAYIGFDAVSAIAQEAKNPRRDLPIAIVGSLVVSMVLYLLVAFVLTGMVAYDELAPDAPLARAFDGRVPYAGTLISLGAIVATTTVLLAFSIGLPRIFRVVAQDGLLPERLAEMSKRLGTPLRLTILAGVITAIGAALIPLEDVADLTVIGTLFIYVLVSAGVLVLKVVEPEAPRTFRVHWIFPALGILTCLGLTVFVSARIWLYFLAWMGLGFVLYGFYGHRRALLRRVPPGRL